MRLLLLVLLLLASANLMAQKTGIFTETIDFEGNQRDIYYYVYDDYDNSEPHVLVIGMHPGTGARGSYIRRTLLELPDSLGAVVACPDDPEYTGTVIWAAIDHARANYNIDTTRIILTGYSAGAYTSVKVSLEKPGDFLGVIALALPGGINNLPTAFQYRNVQQIPVAIFTGSEDDYIDFALGAMDSLRNYCGYLMSKVKPGLVHRGEYYYGTEECIADWMQAYRWFLKPRRIPCKLDIVKAEIVNTTNAPVCDIEWATDSEADYYTLNLFNEEKQYSITDIDTNTITLSGELLTAYGLNQFDIQVRGENTIGPGPWSDKEVIDISDIRADKNSEHIWRLLSDYGNGIDLEVLCSPGYGRVTIYTIYGQALGSFKINGAGHYYYKLQGPPSVLLIKLEMDGHLYFGRFNKCAG